MLECDFCAGVDPRWQYPTAPTGSWHACQPCHELIDAGLWTELAARATTLTFSPHWHLPEDQDAYDPAVVRQRDDAWAWFRANRHGPAVKLGRERPRRLVPWRSRLARTAAARAPSAVPRGTFSRWRSRLARTAAARGRREPSRQ